MLSCESSAIPHGYCVYFVYKNISGSSVDESVFACLSLHFSSITSSAAAFEYDILSVTLFSFSLILLMCVAL